MSSRETETCNLCGNSRIASVRGAVRDRADLTDAKCLSCDLVFLRSPTGLNVSYEMGEMRSEYESMTAWRQATLSDDLRRISNTSHLIRHSRVLDFGAGNGQFALMAGRVASEVEVLDLDVEAMSHLSREGVKTFHTLDEADDESYDVITCFHVIEHLTDPQSVLRGLSRKLAPGGRLVVEVPNSDDALLSLYGCESFENFTYWSYHPFLYNEKSLSLLFKQVDLQVDSLHQIQRYPLSNHLHWLSRGKPDGHVAWEFMNDDALIREYERVLSSRKMCDTITAVVSK